MANVRKVKTPRVSIGCINPDKPEKEYFLFYNLNALAEMEERHGSIDAALSLIETGKLKDIIMLLWYGIIHQECILDDCDEIVDYSVTKSQVGNWIGVADIKDVSEAISQAFEGQLSDKKEAKDQALSKLEALSKNMETQGIQIAQLSEEEQIARAAVLEERKKS